MGVYVPCENQPEQEVASPQTRRQRSRRSRAREQHPKQSAYEGDVPYHVPDLPQPTPPEIEGHPLLRFDPIRCFLEEPCIVETHWYEGQYGEHEQMQAEERSDRSLSVNHQRHKRTENLKQTDAGLDEQRHRKSRSGDH